jgi:hypothetical protein
MTATGKIARHKLSLRDMDPAMGNEHVLIS